MEAYQDGANAARKFWSNSPKTGISIFILSSYIVDLGKVHRYASTRSHVFTDKHTARQQGLENICSASVKVLCDSF